MLTTYSFPMLPHCTHSSSHSSPPFVFIANVPRPAGGHPSVDHYYAASSSTRALPSVTIPLLAVHAADDPVAPLRAAPLTGFAANPHALLVVTPTGGWR